MFEEMNRLHNMFFINSGVSKLMNSTPDFFNDDDEFIKGIL